VRTLWLPVQREEHEQAEAERGQRTDRLLVVFGQLPFLEEFHDLGFDWAGIVPRRECEDPWESGQERVTGEIRTHNWDDQFLVFQGVAQIMLNHLTGGSRYDRQNTVGAINGCLRGYCARRSAAVRMLGLHTSRSHARLREFAIAMPTPSRRDRDCN